MNRILRVLHVEDRERDVALLTRHLSRAGYELVSERVETAAAMKAALESREWDVILCDYSMPHLSALSALAVLKETRLDIPFIIISGTIGEELAVEAMRAGAHDYLMKDNLVRLAPTIERELHEAENRRARRVAEESLKASEAELRSLFAAISDVIFVFDSEGRYLRIAPTGPTDLYAPPAGRIGKTLHEVFPKDEADFLLEHIRRALDEGQMQRVEYSLQIEGAEVWFDGSVSPLSQDSVVWVARDITERKRAEKVRRKLLHDLAERVKELTALHEAARILQWEWTNTSTILLELAELLPPAFQYPELTAARVRLGSIETATRGFADSRFALRADFTTADGQSGSIEVVYTENCPPEAEGPFLAEERALINTLGDMLRTAYDRRQTETALRESEGRFRQLAENIREVFWMRTPEISEILYVSPVYESIWGRPRESLSGKPRSFLDAIHPEDRERTVSVMEHEQERGFELEYRIVKPDGQVRWIWDRGFPVRDESGRVYRIAGIAEDITERKRAEEKLRQSESLLVEAQRLTGVGSWDWEIQNNSLTWSEELYRMYRVDPQEFTPTLDAFMRFLHPEDRDFVAGELDTAVKNLEPLDYQLRIVRPDGEVRILHSRGKIVADEHGLALRMYGAAQDITERVLAEERLRKFNEKLRALAARLQAVREEQSIKIAREIHDELGGGLTGLKMDVAWIERRLSGAGDEAVRQKLRSMSELIDETIEKVRNISTELRPSVLDDLGLAAAVEWQAREFQRRTEIECVITSLDEEVALSAEKSTAVFRIFQELLTNVARHARATRVEISMEKPDGHLVLRVCDDGRGIRESDISDTKSLGLLGVRERAVVFGGVVEIEGAKGRGTTVTVRIPLE